jgi:2-amino-4-hydroxy-6-hydroxymethyldihydropteridine diphosphokinase
MVDAIILIGSNIDPVINVGKAIKILHSYVEILKFSTIYETEAVGSLGPNFLNLAVLLKTSHDSDYLKWKILRTIENELGRVRSSDKNAPRTIDLDITIFDGKIIDGNLWKRFFVAIPVAELCPDLKNPESGETLSVVSKALSQGQLVIPHLEISYE